MKLEEVSVELRPRNPWEAMDLGFVMAREWWRPVYGAWFAVTLPLYALLTILLWEYPLFAVLGIWWLKPLFDRVLLHVYSRSVFGVVPTLRETLRAVPSLFGTGLLGQLTVFRFTPFRSFVLPVLQLERLTGRARRERIHILRRTSGGHAAWLTVTCVHLEAFLQFGLLLLGLWLIPGDTDSFDYLQWFFDDPSLEVQALTNLLYLISISAIQPAYVAAGFALYLNRRTVLEGWDIELLFRRMARRLSDANSRAGATTLVLCIVVSAGLMVTPAESVRAEWDDAVAESRRPMDDAPAVVEEVLADEAFTGERTVKVWARRDAPDEEDIEFDDFEPSELSRILGRAVEVLLWGGLAVLLVLMFVYRDRWLRPVARGPASEAEVPVPPEMVAGLDVRPDSLPDDIPAAARALWQSGHTREALSLLYRGSLSALVGHYAIDLPESATEGDVLMLARPALDDGSGAFLQELTRAWQLVAYGHRLPDDTLLAGFCDGWARHFGAAS